MNRPADPSKRAFLQAAVALGGGLLIGLRLPADESYATHNGEGTPFAPNAWIRIGSDGLVFMVDSGRYRVQVYRKLCRELGRTWRRGAPTGSPKRRRVIPNDLERARWRGSWLRPA